MGDSRSGVGGGDIGVVDRGASAASDSALVFSAMGGRAVGRKGDNMVALGRIDRGGSFKCFFGSKNVGGAKNRGQNHGVDGGAG